MSILDHFEKPTSFMPVTVTEVLAIRLATRVKDEDNVQTYLTAARRLAFDQMLSVVRRTASSGLPKLRAEILNSIS